MLSHVPQQQGAYQAAQLDHCHGEVGELLCACARLAIVCRWAGPVSTPQYVSAGPMVGLAPFKHRMSGRGVQKLAASNHLGTGDRGRGLERGSGAGLVPNQVAC